MPTLERRKIMPKTETVPAIFVEQMADVRIAILRLAHTPHLSNSLDTIAPYGVWITYRLDAGATEHTWDANVSGYRVTNGVVQEDVPASIQLWSINPYDIAPDWLKREIENHTPVW
ncbi:hypothetical protein [Streptomyces griseorubiginosus]|uniref:hypothetical protein n=1 Tax=Streptomyces griseorubiginosus TaxID=67304 RepID=UPI0036E3A074